MRGAGVWYIHPGNLVNLTGIVVQTEKIQIYKKYLYYNTLKKISKNIAFKRYAAPKVG